MANPKNDAPSLLAQAVSDSKYGRAEKKFW